jgi:hypothetical protein
MYYIGNIIYICLILTVSCSSANTESNNPELKKNYENPKIEGSRIAPGLQSTNTNISQKPVKNKQTTIYSGSAKASFGTFNYRWIIDPKGTTQLSTLESSGSGELPAREKKIFIQIRNHGTTKLYQEWFPLLNEKKPVTLKHIVDVQTAELFSAFTDVKLPNEPVESASDQKNQSIIWGKTYKQNNIQYLPASIATSSGKLNIFLEKKANKTPELFAVENSQRGKTSSKLYLWINESNNTTVLFLEKQLQSKNGNIPYLSHAATVKTDELIAGFNSAQ